MQPRPTRKEGQKVTDIDLAPWRDPDTGAFNLDRDVKGRGLDNGLVTTARALNQGLITIYDFLNVFDKYWNQDTGLHRYPGSSDFMSYDDHIAVAMAGGFEIACIVSGWLAAHDWTTSSGEILWQPLMVAVLRIQSDEPLSPPEIVELCTAFSTSMLSPRSDTSGKQLFDLSYRALSKSKSRVVRDLTEAHKAEMRVQYPSGKKEMIGIYYTNPDHPFNVQAREANPQW